MTPMTCDLNGRQPQWKVTSMEGNLNGRQQAGYVEVVFKLMKTIE